MREVQGSGFRVQGSGFRVQGAGSNLVERGDERVRQAADRLRPCRGRAGLFIRKHDHYHASEGDETRRQGSNGL